MKYIVLLGDGMADYPLEELGGKTPLEAARTPNMDALAAGGTVGLVDTIPAGLAPGSDVANLSVLGYDPVRYHSGRAPLEAASMGIPLAPDDVAYRCNLVTLGPGTDPVMEDFTAGHISNDEAAEIIGDIDRELGSSRFRFFPGVGYRHLMVWKDGPLPVTTTPPHDITGQPADAYLPRGEHARELRRLMAASREILKEHPVNLERAARGKNRANSIWLWGEGRAPAIEPMTGKYGISGGVISAVDLLRGIGYYAGLEIIRVEGATGYIDTNYEGKAAAAIAFLHHHDFVFLHVEAPDEMGHEGNRDGKIRAIEDFDEKIVGTVRRGCAELGPFRIAVLSDHPTPIAVRTHVSDPSPFVVYSSLKEENLCSAGSFGETEAAKSGIVISPGHVLMDHFILDWRAFIAQKRDESQGSLC